MAKAVHGRPSREPYWRQVLARWKRSGLSVRAFCGAEGLNPMTFYWWRGNWRDATSPSPPSSRCTSSPRRPSRDRRHRGRPRQRTIGARRSRVRSPDPRDASSTCSKHGGRHAEPASRPSASGSRPNRPTSENRSTAWPPWSGKGSGAIRSRATSSSSATVRRSDQDPGLGRGRVCDLVQEARVRLPPSPRLYRNRRTPP